MIVGGDSELSGWEVLIDMVHVFTPPWKHRPVRCPGTLTGLLRLSPWLLAHTNPSHPTKVSTGWYTTRYPSLMLFVAPTFAPRWHRCKAPWNTPGQHHLTFKWLAGTPQAHRTLEPPNWFLLSIQQPDRVPPAWNTLRNTILFLNYLQPPQ